MEAPRGAREPTGTNGPTLNKHPKHVMRGETIQATHAANHYAHHDQPTPHHQMVGSVLNTKSCGGHSTGETPSTIPNLEAKPGSANGTATDRLWESRTPPQHNKTRGTAPPHGVPSLSIPTPPTTSHHQHATGSATGSYRSYTRQATTRIALPAAPPAAATGGATSSAMGGSARPPPGELSTNAACNSPNTAPHHATIP